MSAHSSRARSVLIGLFAVVAVWVSAGISVPLVKKYAEFRPEALLIVRSIALVFVVLIFSRRSILKPDRYVLLAGMLFAIASITFFRAINMWSANPVIIIITLTPLVNFAIILMRGGRISAMPIISLILVFAGVSCALEVWRQSVEPRGLLLSVVATISTGMGIDYWSRTKIDLSGKLFWYGLLMLICSTILLLVTSGKVELVPPGASIATALYVFCIIGCLGGITYFYAAAIVLERLPVTTASILLQGETPGVIIGSWYILKDPLSPMRWFGVILMLVGISILMAWTTRSAKQKVVAKPSG